jgi:hypothetical protein
MLGGRCKVLFRGASNLHPRDGILRCLPSKTAARGYRSSRTTDETESRQRKLKRRVSVRRRYPDRSNFFGAVPISDRTGRNNFEEEKPIAGADFNFVSIETQRGSDSGRWRVFDDAVNYDRRSERDSPGWPNVDSNLGERCESLANV